LPPGKFDVLVVYTRTWVPSNGVTSISLIRQFLTRFYEWEPAITAEQCEALGMTEKIAWTLNGQTISVYTRDLVHNPARNPASALASLR
jgi:hypothetical protein